MSDASKIEAVESLGTRRRRFLKLFALGVASLGATAACKLFPEPRKEDLPYPEEGFLKIEDGANLYLSVKGEEKAITIRYGKNVDTLVARRDRVLCDESAAVYQCPPVPMKNGETTRRATGEILGSAVVTLRPVDAFSGEIPVYDTAGEPQEPGNQQVTTIKLGQKVEALQVVTWYDENLLSDETALYEINGNEMPTGKRPEKFTNGWAIGNWFNELDNPNPVFRIQGYVPNNKVLTSA